MSNRSKIQWTDASWQVTAGCTKVSPGCDNCYALPMSARLRAMGNTDYWTNVGKNIGKPGSPLEWTGAITTLAHRIETPLHWRKPRRIFVNSMSDLFHPAVPFEFIDCVFETMYQVRRHTFQILTKRAERMAEYFQRKPSYAVVWPLPNVWLGTTCENQEEYDRRWPILCYKVPAAMTFLSLEPLLGPIDLRLMTLQKLASGLGMDQAKRMDPQKANPGLVICGPETGPRRRPCDPSWIRGIVEQCAAASVPCFVKAYPVGRLPGGKGTISKIPAEWPEWARVQQFPEVSR